MKLERTQHVYVIENPALNQTKIGITENLKARMSSIRGESGCEIILRHATQRIAGAREYETKLHQHFEKCRTIGEWFKADPEDIILKVKEITLDARIDGVIKLYQDGYGIFHIMEVCGMSRTGIIKHLKQSEEYNPNKVKPIISTVVKKPHLMKEGMTESFDIRIESHIYTNRYKDQYVYRVYSNGGFKERFFDDLIQTQRFKARAIKTA
jgi:hypothetical protein